MELHGRGNLWLYVIVTSLQLGVFVIEKAVNRSSQLFGWYVQTLTGSHLYYSYSSLCTFADVHRFYIYLTVISGTIQALYFGLCVLEHVWARLDRSDNTLRTIQKVRDFCFASVVFPVSIFVGFGFYTVILHFGTSITDILLANYEHGVSIIYVLLEIYFVSHNYPEDKMKVCFLI